MGYSDYDKKGNARTMRVSLSQDWRTKSTKWVELYEGDPKESPWSFDVCGTSRFVGGPCERQKWAK